jgi:hypothetical protein
VGEPIIVLQPGERLLWSGRPRRVAPVGWEWCRLVVGSILLAVIISLAGVHVLLVLLWFVIFWVPVLARLWTTHRAVYAVTDQRVVVADRISGRTRKWMDSTTPAVTSLRGDGVGTLTFHPLFETVDILGFGLPKQNQPSPIALFAVPDAEQVRALIQEAQAAD